MSDTYKRSDIYRLTEEASRVIDSSWHYSWHWERLPGGCLSTPGVKQAIADGERLKTDLERHLIEVKRVLKDLKGELVERIELDLK